ncbi:sensor histidine kinase [Sulfitobacter sp. BDSS02]|nr:sensor histidine kinase [Sulfitobacter sp. BDSS02]MBR9850020.1 HAMP domain-containing histidine kinase [Paracoccaceae bacterium]
MTFIDQNTEVADAVPAMSREERQIRDYFWATMGLIWQRQAIFGAAAILTMFYFDPLKSLACYGAVLFTELNDLILCRRVTREPWLSEKKCRMYKRWIIFNTILSALGICIFIFIVAQQQSIGGHFTPLFFLFAAALFAAMNNHQIFSVLAVRLSIYAATFFAIALMDIFVVRPPLSSELWLHFFTVVFVLYFVIDCSFVFLKFYRKNMRQLEDLQAEHERTKAAYRVKSQFVAVVSHELRTPLTSIKGSLDLLNSGALGPLPDKMKPIMNIAGKNSARLADLINDILDLQKIEAGEIRYSFTPLDVRELVRDSVEMNRGYADSLKIGLEYEMDERDEAYIRGDAKRLAQVMSNMISNAVKFSNKGGTVVVGFQRHDDLVRITVTDTGRGIPEDSYEKVFGKFTQVDSTDQREVGGTGLGLSISKQIVEHHDGIIDYTSKMGSGTTFYIEFASWSQAEAA